LEINGTENGLLFDSGLSPLVVAHNTDVLGLDLSYCELVVSSHGHIDHAGGLLNIRKKMNAKQNIPLLLHEHAFRNRLVKFQDGRMLALPTPAYSGFSSFQNVECTKYKVDDNKACDMVFTGNPSGNLPVAVLQIASCVDKKMYTFTMGGSQDDFDSYLPTFDNMLASFRSPPG
jgi:metal-dependent hydrolase (beta-lactamase superfamily II)